MSSERGLLYLTHNAETVERVRLAGSSSREALDGDPNLRDATLHLVSHPTTWIITSRRHDLAERRC